MYIERPYPHTLKPQRGDMCRAWKFDLRIIQQLAFAPEERYVYRTAIGPIPALQRSAICIVKASRHNPSPSGATVSNLRYYSILLPICKYGVGQIKKTKKAPEYPSPGLSYHHFLLLSLYLNARRGEVTSPDGLGNPTPTNLFHFRGGSRMA